MFDKTGMNTGPMMMLKALGFDPEKIVGMVQGMADKITSVDNHLSDNSAKLETLSAEIKELRANQARIIELLETVVSEKLTTTNGEPK